MTGLRPARLASALCLSLGLVLSGCASDDGDLIDTLMGKEKDVRLPGKRETFMTNPNGSDGRVASDPIVVPAAISNQSWAAPGGVAAGVLHNLQLSRQLRRAFTVSAGAGSSSDGRLTAPPIVVGGRIFVLDTDVVARALDARSGRVLWQRSLAPKGADTEGAFGGGLASDGARVYAVTGFGEAVAIDAAGGGIVWRKSVKRSVRSAPTVADGRMVFVDTANHIHALSTSDGAEVWNYEGLPSKATIISATAPAIAKGYVVAPATTGDLYVFRLGQGYLVWNEGLTATRSNSSLASINTIAGRPAVAGGVVYAIANAGRMAAFKLETGEEIWSSDLAGSHTPWVAGDYVFVIVGRDRIAAVARRNGAVRWWARLPGNGTWAGPVMGGGRLLAVSSKGQLAEISPQTGQIMATRDVGSPVFITPIIANATLYLLADDGNLIAMR